MIKNGIKSGVFPCAAFATGDKNGEMHRMYGGHRSLYPEKKPLTEDTLFDMASLTKIISATMIAFKLMESGQLNLMDTLNKFFDAPSDKKNITIRNLLTHTSGLYAAAPIYECTDKPEEAACVILNQDLLYAPGSEVTYSCLGYILLGRICEGIKNENLDKLADELVFKPLGLRNTVYKPDFNLYKIAKTEYSKEHGTWLQGVVHDENARFLNGVSGNAGVFSDISDASVFSLMLANKGVSNGKEFINRSLFNESIQNHTKGLSESRGYGFVIKDEHPVSAGSRMSAGSYGHTGFTGTSIWADIHTSQYFVLLTNRVHPTRENTGIIEFRKQFHDICKEEYNEINHQ